eukprot:92023-Prymnesium_polylepis.1
MACKQDVFLSIERLPVSPGWWRANELSCSGSQDEHCLHRCSPAEVCLGGNIVREQCRDGHYGVRCSVCLEDYYKNADNLCEHCGSDAKFLFLYVSPVPFAFILLIYYLFKFRGMDLTKITDQISRAKVADGMKSVRWLQKRKLWLAHVIPKVKIIVSLWQVQLGVIPAFKIELPTFFVNILNWLKVLDFDLPFDCLLPHNFHIELIYKTSIPLGLSFLAFLWISRSGVQRRDDKLNLSHRKQQKRIKMHKQNA